MASISTAATAAARRVARVTGARAAVTAPRDASTAAVTSPAAAATDGSTAPVPSSSALATPATSKMLINEISNQLMGNFKFLN